MSGADPKMTRRPDGAALVIAAILAAIAAVITWQTMNMPVAALYARVGPTTFPYVIAGGLFLLAIGTVVSALRGSFPARDDDNYIPILWIVAGLVGQLLLLSSAGFSIATGVLFGFTAQGFGRGPLWKTIPIGAVFAFIVWFAFAKGLQLSLPSGPLERLIP
jgi:putative tricarboxylic transport membrane protein